MALRPVQTEFPIEAAGVAAKIARGGMAAIQANKAKLSQAANDLASWGAYEAFGDPDQPPKVGAAPAGPEPTDDQMLGYLEGVAEGKPMGLIPAVWVLKFAVKVLLWVL